MKITKTMGILAAEIKEIIERKYNVKIISFDFDEDNNFKGEIE